MPMIDITMFEGRSDEQKSLMYREITAAMERTLDVPPETVRITVREIKKTELVIGGETYADRLAKAAKPGS